MRLENQNNKIELFKQAFINKEFSGIIVTEDIFIKALNKCAGDKRFKYKIGKAHPNEEIIEKYVDFDDMVRAINSANNLQVKKPDTSVKFDDVRNMDLSLDNWETYTEQERKFARQALCAYNDYYDLDAPNDRTGIYDVIDLEVRMQTIRLFIRLSKKKDEIAEYDNKLKELRQQWSKALDDLNLKKKQRDSKKDKPTDTTVTDYVNAIKSLDEMQKEVEQKQLEIQQKKAERRKRNK